MTDINFNLLADEDSKQRFQEHCKLLQQKSYVQNFSTIDGQLSIYRHPEVKVRRAEQIVSINPHLGGPLKHFVQAAGAQARIHCFEERSNQYSALCRNLLHWHIEPYVVPVCAGVWSETGLLTINHMGHSGAMYLPEIVAAASADRSAVRDAYYAYKLDDYLACQNFRPSLIECGRPGLAYAIIQGAKRTIQQLKPRLILVDSPSCSWLHDVKKWVPEYRVFYSECGRRKSGAFLLTL
ncbi:class I SAM-dependent methyltransferase [Rheinheimera faecalis]|uniref:hypothetical protein n=1 Tax=Rheinheimera faecalis TaxID=2901141 RepID=UPI001E4C9DD9|nr:hypothetical protein [Rheinheimera faecalis]